MKILFIAPHLSTGGMPEFLRKRIEALTTYSEHEIWVVEYSNYSNEYTVQKEKIRHLVGKERFMSLGWSTESENLIAKKYLNLKNLVEEEKFDIIHIESFVEKFDTFNKISDNLSNFLFSESRTWKIVETPHGNNYDSTFDKKYIPDGYMYCTEFHLSNEFSKFYKQTSVINVEYPVENKSSLNTLSPFSKYVKNILNIGLWAPHKNQKQVIDLAREVHLRYPNEYRFHFVGNLAENFRFYWEPLLNKLPPNVVVWNERNDIDSFYSNCDAVIHLSLNELNPLVLKEALSFSKKIFLNNLDVYFNRWDCNAVMATGDTKVDATLLVELLKNSSIPHNRATNLNILEEFSALHTSFYKDLISK
jgi:hypothetical protein